MRRTLIAATALTALGLSLSACNDDSDTGSSEKPSASNGTGSHASGDNLTARFTGQPETGDPYTFSVQVGKPGQANGKMTVIDSSGQESRPLSEAAQCMNNSDDLTGATAYPITAAVAGSTSSDMSRTLSLKILGPSGQTAKVVWLNNVIAECDQSISLNKVGNGASEQKKVGFIVTTTPLTTDDRLVMQAPNSDKLSDAAGCTLTQSTVCSMKLK